MGACKKVIGTKVVLVLPKVAILRLITAANSSFILLRCSLTLGVVIKGLKRLFEELYKAQDGIHC